MNLSTMQLFKAADAGGLVLSEEQIHQIQHVVLSIAEDIFSFCERNGILFFLGGGSALGAVRHKGFIPWDDDIDLNMPRADYDRFIELFPKEFGDKYWIHEPGKSEGYSSLMTKVVLKGTVFRQYEDRNSKECGIFVDIFVIENTYDNKLRRNIHGYGCIILSAAVSCRRFCQEKKYLLKMFEGQEDVQRIIRCKAMLGWLIGWISLDAWVQIADKWNKRCRDQHSRYVSVPTGKKRFFGEMYDRDSYLAVKKIVFENRELYITRDYDNYLRRLYGNYMEIPPEGNREKHFLLEFDLGEYDE